VRIVVCLKQILDPEVPAKDFRVDPTTKRPIQGNAKLVVDSYSENALEVGIQLKEKSGGKLVAVCVGDKRADEVLRRALALTADEAIRAWDPAWQELDAAAVAHVLARAIRATGGADVVLLGRQSGDVERGLVGPMLAEELGAPCVTVATGAEPAGDRLRVRREAEGGYEAVEVPLPAVLTVTNDEANVPRLPKVKDVMMATRKPVKVLGTGDLQLDPSRMDPGVVLTDLYVPEMDSTCEFVEGDDGPAKATALATLLRERKIL